MTKNNKLAKGRFELTKDHERAVQLFSTARHDEAEAVFRALLRKNQSDVYAIYHIALILNARKQHAEALALTEKAVLIAPAFAPIWAVHAVLQQALGLSALALKSYDRALQLQPDFREALLNSGVLLREVFQHHQALERFHQLLKFDPDHQAALGNAATLLAQIDQPQQAIAMFARLLQLNPDYPEGPGMLVYEQLRSCDWTDLAPMTRDILAGVRAGRRVCRSFALMALPSSASDQYACARQVAQERFPPARQPLWNGEVYEHGRLRIGYVSPDFREHPVSHLMSGIFECHDRSRFETIAISLGVNDNSALRRKLETSFDRFVDVAGLGSLQIAQRIREMEIDILVDLAGYTSDARPEVFAHRPAPVQVNYLGYPGTLGTSYHDVILADRHVIPPEHRPFYTERVVYLPDTYLPTDGGIRIAERTPTRAECGLPESGAVLCAFSHNFKIHPAMFGVWMSVLSKVPGSVLWLAGRPGPMQDNLRREAKGLGVDPDRLVFAGRVPLVEDHLARYRLADLFLDTSPYNAHTTAADALMVGLPVVTCQGDAFPARVAASLLHAIGMPELVAGSLAEYETLVLGLLADAARLADVKARLAANRQTHALFDSERFCRHLEAAFLEMRSQPGQGQAAPAGPVSDPQAEPVAVPTKKATVYIEESGTPIYARIAKALGAHLASSGLEVLVIQPAGFTQQSFLSCVQGLSAAAVYVTNAGRNIIQHRLPDQPTHYFEHFPGRLVFLHQDSILSSLNFEQGLSLLQAWKRVAQRSLHLCIEPSSVRTLHLAGIENARLVSHASETLAAAPLVEGFEHQVSFVGHVVPSVYRQSSGSTSVDALVQRLYEHRQKDFSVKLQSHLDDFTASALECLSPGLDNQLFRLAYVMWLRGQLMHQSMQFRGWVFEQAQIDALEVFGGDPGYLHGMERSLQIERDNVHYRSAVYDPTALRRIFAASVANVNITSLQFDHAVVNRFHDVFMAGGLCLTDRRDGLAQLTRHHADLSFGSLPELEERLRYFSRPDKRLERAQLIRAVQQEIVDNSGYPRLALEVRRFIETPAN